MGTTQRGETLATNNRPPEWNAEKIAQPHAAANRAVPAAQGSRAGRIVCRAYCKHVTGKTRRSGTRYTEHRRKVAVGKPLLLVSFRCLESTSMTTPALSAEDIWRLFAETDRRFQESERRFQETERLLAAQSAETDRLLKARSDETDRKIRELSKNLGEIGNRLGEFVEHIDRHVQRMKKLKRMLPAYRHHQAFGAVAALVVPDHVAQYAQQQGFYVLAQSGDTVEVRNDAGFTAKAW
jgi:hypothetical protein